MAHDASQWEEMARKSKGCFSYPDDADERVRLVIEIYGHNISVANIQNFVQNFVNNPTLPEIIEQSIREYVFENRSEVLDNLLEEHEFIFESLYFMLGNMLDFDFVAMRVATLSTPLQEMLSSVSTVKDVVDMAMDEVLWIFCYVFLAATYVVPAFEEV